MAHAWHHAVSSARKFGGDAAAYEPIHTWLDASKAHYAGPGHRALRHHALGAFEAGERFGVTIDRGDGRRVPVRLIAEQHIVEDLGRVPSLQDWLSAIAPKPWMLGRSLDRADAETGAAETADRDDSLERWRANVAVGRTTVGYADWLRARAGASVVRPFLDVSTAHLTPDTRAFLDGEHPVDDPPPTMLRGPFGWMIHIAEEPGGYPWPDDLAEVLAHGRAMGCDYVLFDADAAPIDGLAVYDDDEATP